MYKPEMSLTGFGDSVIVITNDGWTVGRYTGNSRDNHTFEIRVIVDMITDKKETMWLHKEDLYKNTDENYDKVKRMCDNIEA